MILKILPLIITFWLGYFVKKIKIFNLNAADIFLKTIFYITLPPVIFLSVKNIKLNADYLLLPLIPLIIIFITYFITITISKKQNIALQTKGSFIISALIINTGFTLPFFMAIYGQSSVAVYTFYDFGNQLLIYTFIYFIAMKHNKNTSSSVDIKKFFKIPPLWALFGGLVFNIFHIGIPQTIFDTLSLIGSPTKFLIMFSLGIYFSFGFKKIKLIGYAILLRSVLGFLIGLALTELLGIDNALKPYAIIFSAAPVGYNTLVLSSLEKLDMDYSAEVVSFSLFLGLLYIPLMIYLFS